MKNMNTHLNKLGLFSDKITVRSYNLEAME